MLKLSIVSLVTFCILACNNSADKNKHIDNTAEKQSSKPQPENSGKSLADAVNGCYMRVIQRDTIVVHLEQTGNSVSGRLTFDNFEKDGSAGQVSGTVEDGILKLVYTFQSEGMTSKREVRFKKVDSGLVMGTGDMRDGEDMSFFTDPTLINYSDSEKLKPVECSAIPLKYK